MSCFSVDTTIAVADTGANLTLFCINIWIELNSLRLDEWQDSAHTGDFNTTLLTKIFALMPLQGNVMTLTFKQSFRFYAGTTVVVSFVLL
jgi:hypothetical protein